MHAHTWHPCTRLPTTAVPPYCLQQYEKNVRKGLLNDTTLALWDSPSLQVGLGCIEADGGGGERGRR